MSETTNNDNVLENVNEDIEAYKSALHHFKLFMMVKQNEISTEILKLESAINDPKSLFGRKTGTA